MAKRHLSWAYGTTPLLKQTGGNKNMQHIKRTGSKWWCGEVDEK